ncbi:hypothetical protein QIS99_15590 [Streptomyces sp. B-S-A8]|uniref:Uncharacterized protein n=1 Tax=Streptomyces solicavernae TaxID=3043614 RepID=A0ABT6RT56_9ACTN|nr:hypothetical protein [Streptomyces sp. B-S-A8]MDI3387613.1 hypothetical protein [Streptomyces sp. B-S-A8]
MTERRRHPAVRAGDEGARHQILTRYNGTNDSAEEYGDRAVKLYDIFERYNAPLRG